MKLISIECVARVFWNKFFWIRSFAEKGKADNDIWYQHKRQWWRFSEDKINVYDDLDNDRIDIDIDGDGDNLVWCDSVSGLVTLGGDALDGDALYGDDLDGDDHAGGNLDSDDLDGDNVDGDDVGWCDSVSGVSAAPPVIKLRSSACFWHAGLAKAESSSGLSS